MITLTSTQIFIGQLGDARQTAAVGLGNLIVNVFANSVAIGFNGCLDTLVSQAYGSGNYRLCGVYTNRVRVVNLVFFVAISGVLALTETLLVAFGQDPETAAMAQTYVVSFIPGVFFILQWQLTNRFLQAQGIFRPQMYMTLFGGLMHIWISYLFILRTNLGLQGAAIATTITFMINFATFYIYSRFSERTKKSYAPWTRESFRGFWEIFRFGIPSAANMFFDWVAMESIALLVGLGGVNQLAASIINTNFYLQLYSIPLSMMFATTPLVGQSLGAGNKKNAFAYMRATLLLAILISLFLSAIMVILRYQVSRLFTADEAVIEIAADNLIIVSIIFISDGILCMLKGTLMGMGYQKYSATLFFIGYWLVTIPLSTMLVIGFGKGINYVWGMKLVGSLIILGGSTLVVVRTNWDNLVISVKDRLDKAKTMNANGPNSPKQTENE